MRLRRFNTCSFANLDKAKKYNVICISPMLLIKYRRPYKICCIRPIFRFLTRITLTHLLPIYHLYWLELPLDRYSEVRCRRRVEDHRIWPDIYRRRLFRLWISDSLHWLGWRRTCARLLSEIGDLWKNSHKSIC